jgi:glycosyltransferase involved in cell wall biosynthesis
LDSIFAQTYSNLEIIIVDDASTDNSAEIIQECIMRKEVIFFPLKENIGNCKAFNMALKHAKGKYIVDFATDDVMFPHKIATQVAFFESLPNDYGVVFSDVIEIDESSKLLKTYYPRDEKGSLLVSVSQGNVYEELIKRAFISPPSMMYRKSMMDEIGGYDESLSYEDYDLWVRTGKKYRYGFQDLVLTKRRIVQNAHSQSFYKKRQNKHLESTLKVCYKAYEQNSQESENKALAISVRYHWRMAVFTENFQTAKGFYELLLKIDKIQVSDFATYTLMKSKIPLHFLYNIWIKNRKK